MKAPKCKPSEHLDRPVRRGAIRVKCDRCGDVFPCHHACGHLDCRVLKNQPMPEWAEQQPEAEEREARKEVESSAALEKISTALRQELPNASIAIDEPQNKDAVWWLDVKANEQHVIVEWRPRRWFGVSTERPDAFGEQSDERFATPEEVVSRVIQLVQSPAMRTKMRAHEP